MKLSIVELTTKLVADGKLSLEDAKEIDKLYISSIHEAVAFSDDFYKEITEPRINKARWVGFGLGVVTAIVVGFLVVSIIYNQF